MEAIAYIDTEGHFGVVAVKGTDIGVFKQIATTTFKDDFFDAIMADEITPNPTKEQLVEWLAERGRGRAELVVIIES